MNTESLFKPFNLKSLNTRNRFVMSPMTRSFSPGGIPTNDVAWYYRKRAEGEVGLIIYHSLLGYLYAGIDTAKAISHYSKASRLTKSQSEKNTLMKKIERLDREGNTNQ